MFAENILSLNAGNLLEFHDSPEKLGFVLGSFDGITEPIIMEYGEQYPVTI